MTQPIKPLTDEELSALEGTWENPFSDDSKAYINFKIRKKLLTDLTQPIAPRLFATIRELKKEYAEASKKLAFQNIELAGEKMKLACEVLRLKSEIMGLKLKMEGSPIFQTYEVRSKHIWEKLPMSTETTGCCWFATR